MPRVPAALPLALAALCLLSAPLATTAVDDAPAASTNHTQAGVTVVGLSENTSRIVPLPDAERANFTEPDASVMAALRMDESEARWALARRTLEQRLSAADSEAARERVLRNATDRATAAVDRLVAQERDLRQTYIADAITTEQYVTALGELDARADSLLRFVGPRNNPARGSLLEHVSRVSLLQDRLLSLQARLTPFVTVQGDSVANAVSGGSTARVHVAASPNGFVLSSISDDLYHRSIYRSDHQDSVRESNFTITESRDSIQTYYPWATDSGFVSSGTQVFDAYAYQHRVSHEQGTIIAYVDASTGLPYHETHETALSVVSTEPGWTNTSGNHTLAVNQSYPGGPLRVQIAGNGTPVSAPVSIDGTQVGTTSFDGVLWTLAPSGEFTVTVQVDDRTLRVNASTGTPPVPGQPAG